MQCQCGLEVKVVELMPFDTQSSHWEMMCYQKLVKHLHLPPAPQITPQFPLGCVAMTPRWLGGLVPIVLKSCLGYFKGFKTKAMCPDLQILLAAFQARLPLCLQEDNLGQILKPRFANADQGRDSKEGLSPLGSVLVVSLTHPGPRAVVVVEVQNITG